MYQSVKKICITYDLWGIKTIIIVTIGANKIGKNER